MRHLIVLDGDDRDEAVVVQPACLDRLAVHLVLQDGYRGFRIPVDAEVVSGAHPHVVVVAAVQFDDCLSTFDVPGVAGHSDDVVEDHVITQEVEVVLSVGQAFESFPDDPEEGPGQLRSSNCR